VRTVAIDFETYYSTAYSVSTLGYYAYTHDARFDCYLAGIADPQMGPAYAWHPSQIDWRAVAHGNLLIAHNAAFDRAVFERLQETGLIPADVEPAGWLCTAAMAAHLGVPRGLAGAAEAILNRVLDKSPRANAKGKQTETLFDAGMAAYCAMDAQTCMDLWEAAGRHWSADERQVWGITDHMGRRGIHLDLDHLRTQAKALAARCEEARARVPWAGTGVPLTSPKALKAWCEGQGIKAPASTDADDPRLAAWCKANPSGAEVVQAIGAVRSLNRAEKVLATMVSRRMPNGRMEAHTLYWGAATGRWSGGGHGLNLQNLNSGDASGDLRGCLVPAPGCVFVVVDLAQIEARCLLWAVGDAKTLDMVRRGISVYEAHARATMGWTGGPLKTSEDPKLYKLAKARVLGLGYGCGAAKFVDVARIMAGLDITSQDATRIVREYRSANPGIIAFWDRLGDMAKRHAGGQTLRVPLPSGRCLRYRNVQDHGGDIVAELVKGDPSKIYGGLLCENYIQALARDVFTDRLLALWSRGIRPVLLVHDEYVIECPVDIAPGVKADACAIIRDGPAWAEGLPIDVEATIMERYAK